MKRLALLLFLSLSCTSYGQNTNVTFDSYLEKFQQRFDSNLETENYGALLNNINDFFIEYNQLNSSDQKTYSYLLSNMKYNEACLLALTGNKSMAIKALQDAVGYGYSDYQHLLSDTDLDPIRSDETFISILNSLREVGDYLYILKKDAGYSNEKNLDIPEFTYESKNHKQLKELRNTYKLDSIAGNGDELSKQINLMRWVHNRIPHDGSKENPKKRNSLDFIKICDSENRGLNCRGLSVILNDVYLAMGYKSRFLTCLPKNLKDPDCHVINIVYSENLKKWLWMDPTNEAYVMDENGVPLSVEEVREHLIHDKPLVLNPDANWNNKISVTANDYLYRYMAKNLYWFQSPIDSRFDLETPKIDTKVRYINLYPEGFHPTKEITGSDIYITTDPEVFWKVN